MLQCPVLVHWCTKVPHLKLVAADRFTQGILAAGIHRFEAMQTCYQRAHLNSGHLCCHTRPAPMSCRSQARDSQASILLPLPEPMRWQDAALATQAPKLSKEEARLDFAQDALTNHNKVRQHSCDKQDPDCHSWHLQGLHLFDRADQ